MSSSKPNLAYSTQSEPDATEERGVALVCLHGLAASSRWWAGVAGELETAGPVRLLDLPRGVPPTGLVAWVAEHLEELETPLTLWVIPSVRLWRCGSRPRGPSSCGG
jgi:pimeloyl-ACP methyl ester carboxylesterase